MLGNEKTPVAVEVLQAPQPTGTLPHTQAWIDAWMQVRALRALRESITPYAARVLPRYPNAARGRRFFVGASNERRE